MPAGNFFGCCGFDTDGRKCGDVSGARTKDVSGETRVVEGEKFPFRWVISLRFPFSALSRRESRRIEGAALKSSRLDPDAIADLYDAALEPGGLDRIPNVIGRLAGVDSVSLCILENDRVIDFALSDSLRETGGAATSEFRQLEPSATGSHAEPVRTKLGAPSGVIAEEAAAGETIRIAPGVLARVGLHPPEAERFSESDSGKALKAVMPHIKRALQLRLRHRRPDAGVSWEESALEALAFGIIVCDRSGLVLYANAAAEAFARRKLGIVLRAAGKQIGTFLAEESRRLHQLIEAAASGRRGPIRLTGKGGTALLVRVTPLPAGRDAAGASGYALLTMRAAMDAPSFSAGTLSALFRLSPAQASLVMALYEGQSFEDIAAARGVKVSTLRTHWAQVLSRTGAKGLRDLIRLLGTLPPLR
jgi:PAS domain-containing protein/DNA-binding CsgD family transcriptional regulator